MDDYLLIENEVIHNMLINLIEQLPAHIHVYLTTRTVLPLPIAKWRVKQWVQELNTLCSYVYQGKRKLLCAGCSSFEVITKQFPMKC